jgi:hypothetical protein
VRAGIIQSSYIPWRGYFDFIDSVDLFVVFDDIPFGSKGNWRQRNQIKTPAGPKWLTVPVNSKREWPIDHVRIDHSSRPWQDQHRRMLREWLGTAPHFDDALAIWEQGIASGGDSISRLNVALIRPICAYLRIDTPVVMSRDYAVTGAKTGRLLNLLDRVGADAYLSGPTARGYLDENRFRERGIRLEYKSYDYPPYPQLWGEFFGAVTVLDLIANTGPDARRFLKSTTPDQVAVP